MKDKILSVLKSCHGRGGYYGITPNDLANKTGIDELKWSLIELRHLEEDKLVYLTRSTQENNRGEIVLICYREN